MTAQQFFKTGHWAGPFAPTQETDRLGIKIGEGVEIGRRRRPLTPPLSSKHSAWIGWGVCF